MAAGVLITETNTGSVTTDAISNINYGSNDSYDLVIATYPINRGDYSYEKFNRYKLSNLSGSNKIDNFKVWLTGSADTGIIHNSNLDAALDDEAYHTPVNTISTEADTVVPTTTPGAENIGKSGANGGLDTNGQYSDNIISQVKTEGTASPGDQTSRDWYYQYDEQ